MLEQIKQLIEGGKLSANKSLNIISKINSTYRAIYNLLYGNLIVNFENNLTEKNLEECKISQKEHHKILVDLKKWFQKANNNLENVDKSIENNDELKKEDYFKFKQELKTISPNGYKLLLEVEKSIEYSSCEKEINKFEDKIRKIIENIKEMGRGL